MKSLLEIRDLVVNIKTEEGEVNAVRKVSFELNKGETLAIVGESGCGKTILCKSILRILPSNGYIKSGEVLLEGEDITKVSRKAIEKIRGKDISMIFQNPMTSLNPTLTVGRQIIEGILINEKISKGKAKEKAIELIEMVGIDNSRLRYNQYPHELSGGMRQRIVIAIALSSNPKILIADEPTTALDVTIQAQILDLLKEIQNKMGLSIIFVTHNLGVVASIADRALVMYGGKIVEFGTVDEIFNEAEHPYTKGLLESLPNINDNGEYLKVLPGNPPNLINPPKGDAFARRNKEALRIDFFKEPPMFKISETHSAATWELHTLAKKVKAGNKDKGACNE